MWVLILLIVPAVNLSQTHKIDSKLNRVQREAAFTYSGSEFPTKKRSYSSHSTQCPRCPSCRSVSNKLKDFGVDHHPNQGDDAILECGYLGGSHDKLVSLEWEKDQVTFFRYLEKRTPKTQIIPQKWLRLQDISYEKSPERTFGINKLIVTLHDVKPEMSGLYTCVVAFNTTVLKTDDDDVIMLGRIQRDAPLTVNSGVELLVEKQLGDPPTIPNILMDHWTLNYDRKFRRPRLFWNDNLSMEDVEEWVDDGNYTVVYKEGATAYLECVSDYEPSPYLSWTYVEEDELIRADASELVHFHKNGKITRLGLKVDLGNKWEFHCILTPRNEDMSAISSAVKVQETFDDDGDAAFELWFIGEVVDTVDDEEEPDTSLPWSILIGIGAGTGLLMAICLACCCCRCRARRKRMDRERKINAIVRNGRIERNGTSPGGLQRGRSTKRKAPKPKLGV